MTTVKYVFNADITASSAEYLVLPCGANREMYVNAPIKSDSDYSDWDQFGTIKVDDKKDNRTIIAMIVGTSLESFRKCLAAISTKVGKTKTTMCFPYMKTLQQRQVIEKWGADNPTYKIRVVSSSAEPIDGEKVVEEAPVSQPKATTIDDETVLAEEVEVSLKETPEEFQKEMRDRLTRIELCLQDIMNVLTPDIEDDDGDEDANEDESASADANEDESASADADEFYDYANFEDYVTNNIPPGWEDFFEEQLTGGYIEEIATFLKKETDREKQIFPPVSNVFDALTLVEPASAKVLIIGQDPYHDDNQATGLAFSVPEEEKIPSSLQNIFKELTSDGFKCGTNGDLSPWTAEGVLLLNTALTVRAHEANSHSKIWESFTSKLLKYINDKCDRIVVIMWGQQAQKYTSIFDTKKHKLISSPHPSGLSASKGFFGSKPFSKANELLKQVHVEPVDWNL